MGEKETIRLEAFSDGVFAIAMTLLVLDLKVPARWSEDLNAHLLNQWPSFVAYLNSFITILIIWINHHNLFTHIKRTNNLFMMLNGLLLLTVTFLPFPTALTSEYYGHPGEVAATALYTGTFVIMAIAFNLLWRYAAGEHRLLGREVTQAQVESINRQYMVGPLFYGLSFILVFISVPASLLLTILLALFYAITGSLSRS